MTKEIALGKLKETKKGNYTKESVIALIEELIAKADNEVKVITRACPKCKGSGKHYGHGAFGEPETTSCYTCNGKGKIYL